MMPLVCSSLVMNIMNFCLKCCLHHQRKCLSVWGVWTACLQLLYCYLKHHCCSALVMGTTVWYASVGGGVRLCPDNHNKDGNLLVVCLILLYYACFRSHWSQPATQHSLHLVWCASDGMHWTASPWCSSWLGRQAASGRGTSGYPHCAGLLHLLDLALGIPDPFLPLDLVIQQHLICAIQGHLHTLLTLPKHAILTARSQLTCCRSSLWVAGMQGSCFRPSSSWSTLAWYRCTHTLWGILSLKRTMSGCRAPGELGQAHSVFWLLLLVQSVSLTDCHH